MYFDVYKDQDPQPQYFFVAKGNNNEALFTSEKYASKQGAMNAIDVLKREAKDADVFDETGER
jgi:uncharacterized protein YegP (UPF0339 family)